MNTDSSGRYSAMYKPFHLIGLELNISILAAALRHQATGSPGYFNADVVAVAKRDLAVGEVLDGEGGYMLWGKIAPAAASVSENALPIGLAGNVKVTRSVNKGQILSVDDIAADRSSQAWQVRDSMIREFGQH